MLIPTKVLRDENSVDNKVKPEDQMSAAAIIKSRCSIITGILRSLVLYLYQNNIDSDKVTDKINAVVNAFASTKDIPPYCVAGGVPAKFIKFYWSIETILEHEKQCYIESERFTREQLIKNFEKYNNA